MLSFNHIDHRFHLDVRLNGIKIFCQRNFSIDEINGSKERVGIEHQSPPRAYLGSNLFENAYYLATLIILQFAYLIISFHHFGRLNIVCAS